MDSFSNIIYDWIQGVVSIFDWIVSLFLYLVIYMFGTNDYTPNMDHLKNGILTPTIYDNLIDYMKYVGTVAAITLFAINFFLLWQIGLKEAKDSVVTAIERVIIAVIIIAISTQILGVFHGRVLAIHNKYVEITTNNATNSDGNTFYDWDESNSISADLEEFLNSADQKKKEYTGDNATTQAINDIAIELGTTLSLTGLALASPVLAIIGIIIGLIHIIMSLFILYFFSKLVVELIKRYLSFCLLNITFPAACGSLASGYTSNIFWMFVKSYVSEALCLTLTKIFIDIGVGMVEHLGWGVDRVFIICAWFQIGLNLEQWFKDHGFCISSAGGNVLDGMVTSAARMTMAAQGVGNTAGKLATNTAAVMGHNIPIAQIGQAMQGKGFGEAAAINGIANSTAGGIEKLVSSIGGGKGMASLGKSEAEAMTRLFKDGSKGAREAFGSRLNSLNATDRKEMFKGLQNSLVNGKDGKLNTAATGFAKTFGESVAKNLSITGVDSRGNLVGKIQGALGSQNVTIGTNAISSGSKKFESADGNDMYMTYGDIDRPTLDNGVLFENFTDSMDTQALSCSEFESMTNLDADELTAFRGMVNELNKAEILSDSTDNWSFVRDEDGNEAAVYQKDGQSYTYAKTKKGETAFYDSYGGMPGHAGKTLEAYEQSFGRKPEDK